MNLSPQGNITRGTTNPNRLRRVDRWASRWPALRKTENPLVVDLGYGASAVTPVELIERLRKVRPDATLVGFEIDPERVASARAELPRLKQHGRDTAGVSFEHGGFETPLASGKTAVIVRAFNVLRQYDEAEVAEAWQSMCARLQPQGVLIEGTCDEIGRVSTWIALTPDGPATLTVSLRLTDLESPSIAAERLPKALIHRNVAGEKVHAFFIELDRWWNTHAGLSSFSAEQRWVATVQSMKDSGWPVRDGRSIWRLGEITVDWSSVAPS
jgi:hypothetical protein